MDCCSKYPHVDYRLHSSMFSSGRLSHSASGGNGNGVPIPGAFYNHLHPAAMRYPHSIYRLTAPGGNTGYNVIGPPPPAPSSLSSASSVSSNSSVSPSSQSPASPNLYSPYERYGTYGNFPQYGYRSRDAEAPAGSQTYANLNHRLDMSRYYGHPYDNYNRFTANYAYRNASLDCDMLNTRGNNVSYSGPYGYHQQHAEYRSGSALNQAAGRYYQYSSHGRNGTYDTHPFSYFHLPHTLNRSPLHPQPQCHPQMNSASNGPYVSPVLSDVGSGTDAGAYGGQSARSTFSASDFVSASSLANGDDRHNVDTTPENVTSHLRESSASSELQYHMRSDTPHGMSRQHYSTDTPYPYEYKAEKVRKFKDRERFLKCHTPIKPPPCPTPLESPTMPPNAAGTRYPVGHTSMPHDQTNYYTDIQKTDNRISPNSTCSPYSWSDQYSPKSVRRKPINNSSTSPSNFMNKNRILECDFIPSKKSRKNIKTEDNEYSPEMRDEIKDITPLPGFQQAFGSTEIGRFSETFLNTPERVDYYCESDADTYSPQLWETGDSLEGPHYNLHIGATVVQPDSYTENHSSSDSPMESSYFSQIQCSDF